MIDFIIICQTAAAMITGIGTVVMAICALMNYLKKR